MSTDAPEPANPVTTTLEDADEHGYLGQPPDPEPNESYTVEGVTAAAASAEASTSKSSGSSGASSSGSSSSKSSSKSSS
jgi:hypothetical protein